MRAEVQDKTKVPTRAHSLYEACAVGGAVFGCGGTIGPDDSFAQGGSFGQDGPLGHGGCFEPNGSVGQGLFGQGPYGPGDFFGQGVSIGQGGLFGHGPFGGNRGAMSTAEAIPLHRQSANAAAHFAAVAATPIQAAT